MADSNKFGGFSFQLSETPPPTQPLTPLGDLDLDFDAFGGEEGTAQDYTAGSHAGQPEFQDFASDDGAQSLNSQGYSAQKNSPDSPRALDQSEDPSPTETRLASAILNEEKPVDLQGSVKKAEISVPRIKKIKFPKVPQVASETRPALSPRPKTKFSESISAPAVANRIADSEPPPALDEFHDDLAFPDDLPQQPGAAPDPDAGTWNSDTPSAKEIWRSARKAWRTTAAQAISLGGQGIRVSRHLASDVNVKMKAHLQAAAQEKAAREALKKHAPHDRSLGSSASEDVPRPPAGLSVAGRVALDLGKAGVRKLAAPLSAIAAAGAVYMGGTHLLGIDGDIALSKAAQSPDIPELGTVDSPKNQPTAKFSDRGESSSAPDPGSQDDVKKAGPSPMQVEVTKMPDGLSWPGKGLIEVVTSEEELIYVDGVFTGRGPLRRIPVSPGDHEVSIRSGGKKRSGSVTVAINKNTRAVFQSD